MMSRNYIENRTYAEIKVGDSATVTRPVGQGVAITVTLMATRKFDHNHRIIFDGLCANQDGQKVIGGTADALLAGMVVGASVPIVLTSRADSAEACSASCAITLPMADAKRKRRVLAQAI